MRVCHTVYAIFENFYGAQSFKRTHVSKFGAFLQWMMLRCSNDVIKAFLGRFTASQRSGNSDICKYNQKTGKGKGKVLFFIRKQQSAKTPLAVQTSATCTFESGPLDPIELPYFGVYIVITNDYKIIFNKISLGNLPFISFMEFD